MSITLEITELVYGMILNFNTWVTPHTVSRSFVCVR